MAKKQSSTDLKKRMASVFDHWSISEEAKERLADQFVTEPSSPQPDKPADETAADETARVSKTDTPKRILQHRVSKMDTPKRKPRKVSSGKQGSKVRERTFRNKMHTAPSSASVEPISNIPKTKFFRYYNTLHDVVLPKIHRNSRLILCVMFRKSHGFNRNWCSISLRELAYATGMGENTVRRGLALLINDSWVTIAADGYREATTYVLQIPIEDDDQEGQKEEDTEESPDWILQNGDSNLEGRVAKLESPKRQPCTSSTYTGQSTEQPVPNPEVHPYSVRPDESEPGGENRVEGNVALKNTPEDQRPFEPALENHREEYLSEIEDAYIRSCSALEQSEIFNAQDAWDEIIGKKRPPAPKLNEMLGHLRELGYKGGDLDRVFRGCLEKTMRRGPDDAVAWMVSALRGGRYP